MARGLLAGSYDVEGYSLDTNELFFTSKTTLNSNLNITVTPEEARAGNGNYLLGRLFHTSGLALTLTDQEWDINYLAMQIGSDVTGGANIFEVESFTLTTANTITAQSEPQSFANDTEKVGYYKLSTESDTEWKKITFEGTTATVAGLAAGTVVCVKYLASKPSGKTVVINTDMTPMIVRLVLKGRKYVSSGSGSDSVKGSSQMGVTQIEIPMFQFDGGQELALDSTSFATASLNGTALAILDGTGCSGTTGGYYATWSEYDYSSDEFDSVSELIMQDSDMDLTVGDTAQITAYKWYTDGTSPTPVSDNSLLTFTSKTPATASVSDTGLVTALAAGQTVIEIAVTANTDISGAGAVTVVAAS